MINFNDGIDYSGIIQQINENTHDFLNKKGKEIQTTVKDETPEKTRKLVDLIRLSDIKQVGEVFSIKVYVDLEEVPYAGYVERGNGRIVNFHKPAGVTKWENESGGRKMFENAFLQYQLDLASYITLNKEYEQN